MVTATVTQGQWTTISGTYTVPSSGMDVTKARIYVETPTTAGASTDLMDFWTDDVSDGRPDHVAGFQRRNPDQRRVRNRIGEPMDGERLGEARPEPDRCR